MKAKLNLREAQKALTRQRIMDAARDLFYRQGFYNTCVDEIALGAGASRPTFYLHFRDKADVLSQIAEEYAVSVEDSAEQLPGPNPTIDDIRGWMRAQRDFFEREKISYAIVSEISSREMISPAYGRRILTTWMEALARRAPSFATAMKKTALGVEARALAELVSLEITWAASSSLAHKDSRFSEVAIETVSQHLFDFLSDPRYADAGPALPAIGKRAKSQSSTRD